MKRLVLEEDKSTRQKGRPFNWNILADLLKPPEKGRTVKTLIMWTKPEEHYAIIGPLHANISDGLYLEYIMFPYADK